MECMWTALIQIPKVTRIHTLNRAYENDIFCYAIDCGYSYRVIATCAESVVILLVVTLFAVRFYIHVGEIDVSTIFVHSSCDYH